MIFRYFIVLFLSISIIAEAEPLKFLKKNKVGREPKNPFVVTVYESDSVNKKADNIKYRLGETIYSDEINFGLKPGVHYVQFTIINSEERRIDLVAHVDIVYLKHFKYFLSKSDSTIYESEDFSWRTPLADRPIPDRYFSFPVSLPAKDSLTVKLALESEGGVLFCPVYLYSQKQFLLEQQRFNLTFQISIVAILVLAMTLVVALFFVRKAIFLYFILYLVGYLIYALNLEGYLAVYAPAPFNTLNWMPIGKSTFSVFGLLFAVQFIFYNNQFISRNWFNYLKKVIFFGYGLFLVILLSCSYRYLFTEINFFISYATSFGILPVTLFGLLKKNGKALLYLLAVAPVQLVTIFFNSYLLESLIIKWMPAVDFYQLYYILPVYQFYLLGFSFGIILIRNLNETSQQLIFAQKRQIDTIEAERERLAQDLHDDLGGTLSAIKGRMANENVRPETVGLIDKAIEDLRFISRDLIPVELEKEGLVKTVQNTIDRLRDSSKINFVFVLFGDEVRLSLVRELNTYRIISELLNNVLRHSKAGKSSVQLIYYDDYLSILVEDDGTGIEKEKNSWGIGLKNIHSRAEFLKAQLTVDSSPKGTTVVLHVPFQVGQTQ